MKRFLLVGAVLIAMFAMLCIGLALGIVISPVKGAIAERIERVLGRDGPDVRVAPRVIIREPAVDLPGTRILAVLPDSPAEQAGLRPGQFITAINGQPLRQIADLGSALSGYEPGDQVDLTVLQADGEEKVVQVTLTENPDNPGTGWLGVRFAWPLQVDPGEQMPWKPEGGDGALPNLPRRRFKIFLDGQRPDPGNIQPGALIRKVVAGSPAQEAGLRPGQIIQAVDGKELDGPEALREIIAGQEPGDTLTLTVLDARAENEQTRAVEVTLGENPHQPGAAWLGIRFVHLNLERLDPQNLPDN